jgi:peroxiredoxin Q/BCP
VTIFGASFDDVEANRKFAEKYDFNFKLLSDPERTMGVAYGAADDVKASHASRVAYLIGADGKIEKSFGKVKPAEFPEQALSSS